MGMSLADLYSIRAQGLPTIGLRCLESGEPIQLFDVVKNMSGRICQVTYLASPYHVGYDLTALNAKGAPSQPVWSGWTIIGRPGKRVCTWKGD